MSIAVASAGAAGPFRDYWLDGAAEDDARKLCGKRTTQPHDLAGESRRGPMQTRDSEPATTCYGGPGTGRVHLFLF